MSSNAALQARRAAAIPRGVATAYPVFAERAEGSELWDRDGKRFIDFAGGIAVLNTGHRHPKVIAAVKKQLDAFTHTAFQIVPYEPYIELCERLNKIAPFSGEAKSILFSTGAEAVENAVKIARAATGRTNVIAFSGAFHGRTLMARALTGKVAPYKKKFGPMPAGIWHVPFPVPQHGVTVADTLKAIDYLFRADVDPVNVAAIIIEPVQGEGGFHPAPTELLEGAARDLRPARHPAHRRRGADRLCAHRQDVRHREFRRRARHHHRRQIAGRRLPAVGRRRQGRDHGRARSGRPRRHLCRQPARLRGGARGARRDRGGEADRARQHARRPDQGRSRRASPSATTRSRCPRSAGRARWSPSTS